MFQKNKKFKKNLKRNSEKSIFKLELSMMPEMKEKRNNYKSSKFLTLRYLRLDKN